LPLCEKRDDALVFWVVSILVNRLVRVDVDREEREEQYQQSHRGCPDHPACANGRGVLFLFAHVAVN
jgi:hypothetical protein